MAPEIDSQVAAVQSVLISLLDRLQSDQRHMTPGERQRYSVGVRLIARCSERSIADVITSLDRRVSTGSSLQVRVSTPLATGARQGNPR